MNHRGRKLIIDMAKRSRSGKRSRIMDSTGGSSLVYVKFLLIWALVLMLDFLLEFRFEYLWPCWLLLRSANDSYRYQGLIFLFFFLCLALTSDVILYLFIPAHWLFFLASTYVWVQFVWNSERGICFPTVILWILFVYVEFSVRLRQMKNVPFNIDLCRPFAAHCIGYPVVTLGFGFKSYISYRCRLRKQLEVQSKNAFYFEILDKVLGLPPPDPNTTSTDLAVENNVTNSEVEVQYKEIQKDLDQTDSLQLSLKKLSQFNTQEDDSYCEKRINNNNCSNASDNNNSTGNNPPSRDVNQYNEDDNSSTKTNYKSNVKKLNLKSKKVNNTDPCYIRLEADLKRLRSELQSSRSIEAELRSQITSLVSGEKQARMELSSLRQDNESLQNRLHNLVQRSQADKAACQAVEKKLTDEKKLRQTVESALDREKRAKDELLANLCAAQRSSQGECTSEQCRARRRDMETEIKAARRDLRTKEECNRNEMRELTKMREERQEREVLMTALNAMKEKNAVLDQALRDENKMKQDLLSALHKARREIDYFKSLIQERAEIQAVSAQGPWAPNAYTTGAFGFQGFDHDSQNLN